MPHIIGCSEDAPLSRNRWIRSLQLLCRGELPYPLQSWLLRVKRRQWEKIRQSGDMTVSANVGFGAKLELLTKSSLSEGIFNGGFEKGELRFVGRYLQKGDIFMDVGANVGLFSVIAGRRVGSSGQVWAVEPSPTTRRTLVRNIEVNNLSNVTVVPCGLSDAGGILTLRESVCGLDAFNSFAEPLEKGVTQLTDVEVQTLDELASGQMKKAPSLIKIDVEGWETKVIRGGQSLLKRDDAPDLMVEFSNATLNAAGSSCGELEQLLRELGYKLFLVNKHNGSLSRVAFGEDYKYANLLASKKAI
jgi:FkbM family methyltransferase